MNKVIGILGFQGMKTGQYGTPPQWTSWAKQTVVFVVGLFLMKCIVLLILKIFPFLFDVGEWLLGWTQSNRYVQGMLRRATLFRLTGSLLCHARIPPHHEHFTILDRR